MELELLSERVMPELMNRVPRFAAEDNYEATYGKRQAEELPQENGRLVSPNY